MNEKQQYKLAKKIKRKGMLLRKDLPKKLYSVPFGQYKYISVFSVKKDKDGYPIISPDDEVCMIEDNQNAYNKELQDNARYKASLIISIIALIFSFVSLVIDFIADVLPLLSKSKG